MFFAVVSLYIENMSDIHSAVCISKTYKKIYMTFLWYMIYDMSLFFCRVDISTSALIQQKSPDLNFIIISLWHWYPIFDLTTTCCQNALLAGFCQLDQLSSVKVIGRVTAFEIIHCGRCIALVGHARNPTLRLKRWEIVPNPTAVV